MKKIIITGLVTLCQMLIFCHSKEKKVEKEQIIEHVAYLNNHKYDDDEIALRKNKKYNKTTQNEDENRKANTENYPK